MLVKVCEPVNVTTLAGNVGVPPSVYVPTTVPESVGELIVGEVIVLLVKVCTSLIPTGELASPSKLLRLIDLVVSVEFCHSNKRSFTGSLVVAAGN